MTHICIDCQKEFASSEALEQHKKDKHKQNQKSTNVSQNHSKPFKKYFFWGVVIIVVIAIGYWVFGSFIGPGKYDAFTQCLSDNGAKFYGAFWCPHCTDQKNLFGQSKKYLPYIECSPGQGKPQFPVCQQANIQGYPTWEFADGSRVSAVMTLEQLSQKTGCPLLE